MRTKQPGRRGFLKTVALVPGLAAEEAQAQENTAAAKPATRSLEFPRVYTGRNLAMIGFPLGGIGTGSISLGGRGQLRDWEIFNRPDKGHRPAFCFASIWCQKGKAKPIAKVLESQILPPYEGSSGLGTNNVPGLPRFEAARFTGEFPLAHIDFAEAAFPLTVSLDAFSLFIPLDVEESGIPVAVLRYRLKNASAAAVKASIAFSIDSPVGKEGRANQWRENGSLRGLLMANPFLPATDPVAGTFALSCLAEGDSQVTYLRGWRGDMLWNVAQLAFWDDFSRDGELGPEAAVRNAVGSVCQSRTIPARGEAHFTFLLTWRFPNRTPERSGWTAPKGDERTVIGNHYCVRFPDAWKAAEYVAARLPELESRTRRFVTAVRETTLPGAVRDAAQQNLSTLVTNTCFRTADGAFHGFEGSNDERGCCFGDCRHVWNYESASAFLFPELSRSMRESGFGYCTDARGKMDLRELLPRGKEHFDFTAADGQMGQIMRLYLDWRLSGNTAWLRTLWPAAKRALEFAWIAGGWDANKDGVMEGAQHNTYDVEFYGPNPLCGVWYLGALRAAEEMAKVVDDEAFATECHQLFVRGSKWIDANLFNGEYYIQKVKGLPRDQVAAGLLSRMGSANTENPIFQVGDGCLIDQLVGQYLAEIAGLGLLLEEANIRKTLESIYKYNYKRVMKNHESVQRTYALNDEAALVICDYAGKPRPQIPFPYFAEVMTGFEHAAGVLMMYRGMDARGIEVIENVRRRYDGERRSPWDEAECGHHYARAMASWAAIPALSGFHYHAADKRLSVKPRSLNMTCFWSTGTGWGIFTCGKKTFTLKVEEGTLPCDSIELPWGTFTPRRTADPDKPMVLSA